MIQPLFNGMLLILLAKFCLNDLPHAAGLTEPAYDRPPTIKQLRYIAGLRQRLKMTITYEREVVTFGEAGRMIRELEAEEKHRKRQKELKGGNPGKTKVWVAILPYSWGGTFKEYAPRKSYLVDATSEAITLAKQDSYFRPWFDKIRAAGHKKMSLVWGTTEGTAYRHTTASFDVPSAGGSNPNTTTGEEIAKELGIRYDGIQEELGMQFTDIHQTGTTFYANTLEEARAGLAEKRELFRSYEKPNTAVGTCYEDAWRFLIKEDEGHLIHGSVQLTAEGARVNHAWVELPTGYIWEPQTKSYYTIEDFKIMNPIEEHRYTVEEAAIMAARTGNHGPWTDEERMKHIGR